MYKRHTSIKNNKWKKFSATLLLALGGLGTTVTIQQNNAHASTTPIPNTTKNTNNSESTVQQTKAYFSRLNHQYSAGYSPSIMKLAQSLDTNPKINNDTDNGVNNNQRYLQSTKSNSISQNNLNQVKSNTNNFIHNTTNFSQNTVHNQDNSYASITPVNTQTSSSTVTVHNISSATSQASKSTRTNTISSNTSLASKLNHVTSQENKQQNIQPTRHQTTKHQNNSTIDYFTLAKQANKAGTQHKDKSATHYGFRTAYNNYIQQQLSNNSDYQKNNNDNKVAQQAQKSDLNDVNKIRKQHKLGTLKINPTLQKEAQATAEYLHNENYLEQKTNEQYTAPLILPNENTNEDTHGDTTYNDKLDRNNDEDYSGTTVGKDMVNSYINQANSKTYDSFRGNILDPNYTNVGIAYYYNPNTNKFDQVAYFGGGNQMSTPLSQIPQNNESKHLPYLSPIEQAKIAYPWTSKSINNYMQKNNTLAKASQMNNSVAQQAHDSELTRLNKIRAQYHQPPLKLAYNNQIVANLDARCTYNIYAILRSQYGWRSAHGGTNFTKSNPERNAPIVAKILGTRAGGYGENAGTFELGKNTLDGTKYNIKNGKDASYAVIDSMTRHDVFKKPDGSTEQNGHLKDIINPNHKYVGIAYIYNPKTNIGVEVDYFTKKPLGTPTSDSIKQASTNTTSVFNK